MRPNAKEGVSWLRKAMDSALLEVTADDSPNNNQNADPQQSQAARDLSEKKAHRAQFALSIYELGVSHLNGWGTEQDKALALRCFEIAGEWGDADALTEAGFCYAEGIGCKKNLRKAAKFYRRAADRGVSMVGNSWYVPPNLSASLYPVLALCFSLPSQPRGAVVLIVSCRIHKSKYDETKGSQDTTRSNGRSRANSKLTKDRPENYSPKKPRNKSKTRSIWSRRKTVNQDEQAPEAESPEACHRNE